MEPHEPPRLCPDLPATGGAIGPELEDFVVEEIALYEPSGEGPHWYVQLEKRGWTTPDAVRAVARVADVKDRDIGSAGMKDKHAVTRQWISLPEQSRDPSSWELPEGLAVIAVSRHRNKLRTGHLSGNRFSIRLSEVEAAAGDRAKAILKRIAEQGMPNYFGTQRFGRGGQNLQRALDDLVQGQGKKRKNFTARLYASVLQSEVFNRYLTRRRDLDLAQPLLGEVVRLEGTSSVFQIEDVDAERPRWKSRDIHPTGPMVGPKMRAAAHQPLALEAEVRAELGLEELPTQLAKHAPGTRRDCLVFPENLSATALPEGGLRLDFSLPAGSYATQLVRELTGADWWQDRRVTRAREGG